MTSIGVLHLCLHLFLSLMSGLHVLLGLISIKLCAGSRAGSGAEAYILREQGLAGPGDEILSTGEGGSGSGVFSPRLRHYFHSFTVVVMTDLPIQKVLQKPNVAGRMVRWAVELSEFHIQYEPRGSIKGQVYADFVAEFSPGGTP